MLKGKWGDNKKQTPRCNQGLAVVGLESGVGLGPCEEPLPSLTLLEPSFLVNVDVFSVLV